MLKRGSGKVARFDQLKGGDNGSFIQKGDDSPPAPSATLARVAAGHAMGLAEGLPQKMLAVVEIPAASADGVDVVN